MAELVIDLEEDRRVKPEVLEGLKTSLQDQRRLEPVSGRSPWDPQMQGRLPLSACRESASIQE